MAKSMPTLEAGSMTDGSLVMPGNATDNTTHVLISACSSMQVVRPNVQTCIHSSKLGACIASSMAMARCS